MTSLASPLLPSPSRVRNRVERRLRGRQRRRERERPGPVRGKAYNAMDAVAHSPATISVVDFAGLCAYVLPDAKPNATYIEIFLDSGFQLGTTPVGASLHVQSNVIDSQCNSVGYGFGAGSVALTATNSSAARARSTSFRRTVGTSRARSRRPCARCRATRRASERLLRLARVSPEAIATNRSAASHRNARATGGRRSRRTERRMAVRQDLRQPVSTSS